MSQLAPITPYYAALVAAAALERAGSNRKPPTTQSMYTRARKGTIKSLTGTDGKTYFDGESFKTWLTGYLNETPKTKVDLETLTDQYTV